MELGVVHLDANALQAGLERIRESPSDDGTLEAIVRRPAVNAREVLDEGVLDVATGLVGDTWALRNSSSPDPDTQLNVMNSRVVDLLAQRRDRWALAGDQLYVDLDLSEANLRPGTRLQIGEAVIEVTSQPHTGCQKFVARFGLEAMKFVNSPLGRQLRLRGLNARVVRPGVIRVGHVVSKVNGRAP